MNKIVLFSLVGLLILLFSGCGLTPFTTPGVEQPSIEGPPEAPEGLEIGLDPAIDLELAQSKGPTRHVPSDTGIGTWDPVNRIYTLTTDVNEGIEIDEDNLTLDGAGHKITGSGSGYGVYLYGRSNVTVKNCDVSGFYLGIYLDSSSSNTLTDNTAYDNYYGISLTECSSNTLTSNIMFNNKYNFRIIGSQDSEYDNDIDISNTVDGKPIYYIRNAVNQVYDSSTNAGTFYCINCENVVLRDLTLTKSYAGVFFWKTSNSRIENINVSENYVGIWLNYSDYNTLTNNTSNNNISPIYLHSSSSNTLTDNTVYDNYYGIFLYSGSSNTLTGNTANNNSNYYGIYLASSSSNTLTDNTANYNFYGISLYDSSSNTLTGNTANNNSYYGIYLDYSSSNTLTGNTANDNSSGISLYDSSSNNTLTDNTVSNTSSYGIWLDDSNYNKVYNNNFINNPTQAYVSGGSGNEFYLDKPVGGNYWSDWTSPDDDCDGFVDDPYVFTGGQDDLPWICQDGWKPAGATAYLITTVEDFGLPKGVEKSLIKLLEAAIDALENHHEQAAIGQLTGFIHYVEAQSGKKLTEEQAQMLIATAQRIIDSIQ